MDTFSSSGGDNRTGERNRGGSMDCFVPAFQVVVFLLSNGFVEVSLDKSFTLFVIMDHWQFSGFGQFPLGFLRNTLLHSASIAQDNNIGHEWTVWKILYRRFRSKSLQLIWGCGSSPSLCHRIVALSTWITATWRCSWFWFVISQRWNKNRGPRNVFRDYLDPLLRYTTLHDYRLEIPFWFWLCPFHPILSPGMNTT